MTKEIRVIVKTLKTHDGKKFNAYTTYDKSNKRYKVKFTKAVKNPPEESCIVVFDSIDANVSEDAYGYVLWIDKITEIKSYEKVDKVADIF